MFIGFARAFPSSSGNGTEPARPAGGRVTKSKKRLAIQAFWTTAVHRPRRRVVTLPLLDCDVMANGTSFSDRHLGGGCEVLLVDRAPLT